MAAVLETLLLMGVDVSDPKAIKEMQADFQHIRSWRTSVETVQRQGMLTAIGIVVSGIIGGIVMALRGTGH